MKKQKKFVITKRIAKHGSQAIIVVPRVLEQRLRPGIIWIVGRSAGSDEMYNRSVVPLSASRIEPVYLPDRTTGGFAFDLSGNISNNANFKSGFVSSNIAYTGADKLLGGRIGVSPGFRRDFSDSMIDKYSVLGTVIYRNRATTLEMGISAPVSGSNRDVMLRTALQYQF